MKPENDLNVSAVLNTSAVTSPARRDPGPGFADMLKADAMQADAAAARAEILADQPAPKANPNTEEIAAIREHGMRHYVEELHKKKLEELREKILEMMGLTEEDLEAMPADERGIIEEMIAREIEARTAAESMMNGDISAAGKGPDTAQAAAAVALEEAITRNGGSASLAVMVALETPDAQKGSDAPAVPAWARDEPPLTRGP